MTPPRRALTAIALLGVLSLTACGGDDGTTAADPAPTTPTETADVTTGPTPSGPTAAPEPGSLPDFPYQDYAYTLQMRCFCANIDQSYRIAVSGGEVTDVTWATDGDGHVSGEEVADTHVSVTIQDIIDRGNDPDAAQVEVEWPAGQEWPDSVYVDKDEQTADEEVTWVISEVQVA